MASSATLTMVTSSWTIVKPKLAAAGSAAGRRDGKGGRDSDVGHGAIFAEVTAGEASAMLHRKGEASGTWE
jgi:hypothetical protein